MPAYTGKTINLPNVRVGSASARIRELSRTETNAGIRATDGSLGGKNIRVANRKIVITTLKRSLALDVQIGSVDLNLMAGIFVVCAGRLIYVWNIETYILRQQMGKSGRSLHKGNIKNCSINLSGNLLATCGDDKRIIVWSLAEFKGLKMIEGHAGIIYQVEFSTDDEKLLSSSEDGRVIVWDWKSGTMLNSCMRHSFAVRSFDFNYERPELVVCARSDGHITVWNTQHSIRIDNIVPDPEWMHAAVEENLMGWKDPTKNHTGPILSVRLSPNGRFLASGATDNTCKIWNISSYRKDLEVVQKELNDTEEYFKRLNGCIDASDSKYDEQLQFKEFTCLKIGEVPLGTGYHADLRYTLRHDAPITCIRWTCNSEIIITGSMDATCRLWSSRRGELLFQINLPGPVNDISVDLRDYIFISCQNRLLIFSIKALFKESDLPAFWHATEVRQVVEDMRHINADPHRLDVKTHHRDDGSAPQYVTISELRRLLAHGLVLPRILHTLTSQFPDVDERQLESNMKKHNVNSRQVLRLLTNQPFHPRDILKALSTKSNTSILYSLISHGSPIIGYMLRLGYAQIDDSRDRTTIKIDPKDLQSQLKSFGDGSNLGRRIAGNADLNIDSVWRGWVKDSSDSEDESETEDSIEDELYQYLRGKQPRGKVLHFIPSEKMKLLKDLKSSRDLKPIFLRSLAMDTQDGRQFPNFVPDNDLEDKRSSRPLDLRREVPKKGPRFNESVQQYSRKSSTGRENPRISAPMPLSMSKDGAIKASLSSSATIFQPNRYVQTRGLNVSFDQTRASTFSQPIVIREAIDEDDRLQMVVGAPKQFKDVAIDENNEYDSM